MILFHGNTTDMLFNSILSSIAREIDQLSDEETATCDIEEWTHYFSAKYSLSLIQLHIDATEKTMVEDKQKAKNMFSGYGEPEYVYIPSIRIKASIPFQGDVNLFQLRARTYSLSSIDVDDLIGASETTYGEVQLSVCFPKAELLQADERANAMVQQRLDQAVNHLKQEVGYVNDDVDSFNSSIEYEARRRLIARKDKLASFESISRVLQIPIERKKNAPNIKPVPLVVNKTSRLQRPTAKPVAPEYAISDEVYGNINNIIYMCGTILEQTARTYYAHNEEQLRDQIRATLNTHYECAEGEAFRKIGKTDIKIECENHAAYIAECKIWRGKKVFQDAVQQVFNYSTWRDVKVSVVIFNKENKDFNRIRTEISEWIKDNAITFIQSKANMWECRIHRNAENLDVQLTIMVFDLYVDKTQFQDQRYN